MPLNYTVFRVSASIDYDKVGIDAPNWDYDAVLEVKVNNLVLTNAECMKIQAAVTDVLAKHAENFKSFSTTMSPKEEKTKRENTIEAVTKALTTLEETISSDEPDLDEVNRLQEEIAELSKKHPAWAAEAKQAHDIDANYEAARADLVG